MALRFGSDAFDRNDLNGAITIYEEARTMFLGLHNLRGAGIATFNVGVVCHKKWLTSEKKDLAAFRKANEMYQDSIANGREIWNVIAGRDVDGVTIDVAGDNTGIQMVQRLPNEPRTISAVALSEDEDSEGLKVKPKRLGFACGGSSSPPVSPPPPPPAFCDPVVGLLPGSCCIQRNTNAKICA